MQIFTTWNNPKGHADTERVIRTFKEDLIWPYDWHSTFDLQASFQQWIIDYNSDSPHQSLAYQTPQQAMGAFVSKEVSIV